MIIRPVKSSDITAMQTLILDHGKNEWNYIPEDKIKNHLDQITSGKVEAVLAESAGEVIGFVTFHPSTHFNRYRQPETNTPHGYIHEAVVHKSHVGKGLGTSLLKEAVRHLQAQGFAEIFIDRHEENLASAGMMRKAGFIEVFLDPQHRTSGSCRTTVCRIDC